MATILGTKSPPSPLYRAATRLEQTSALDPLVHGLERVLPAGLEEGRARDLLGGRWLGHSLHPLLTDLPLGAWMSASLLDVLPGRNTDAAAERLLGFGLLATAPTVAAGLSDWLFADNRERRVGVVHAVVNTGAAALYGASLVARRRGRHRLGVALALGGGVTAIAGGFLGGHLSTARPTALRASANLLTS
jgi:uncharacterized membrane protein